MHRSTLGLVFRQLGRCRTLESHRPCGLSTSRGRYLSKPVQPYQRHRCLTTSAPSRRRDIFRKSPILVTLACGAIAFGIFSLGYAAYIYKTYIIDAFHTFPEPVAQKLRRALYYTNHDVRPREALKYYKEALQLAQELGMSPLSNEVIGIRLQVADLLERHEQYAKTVNLVESVRAQIIDWLDSHADPSPERTRLLVKSVAISIKLGELYANPAIHDHSLSESRLVWAVETSLRETTRRQQAGAEPERDGVWLSNDEIGAALESLASRYEQQDRHHLATPLLLQALRLHDRSDCQRAVIMNNIASSLAQQLPNQYNSILQTTSSNSPLPSSPVTDRTELIQQAEMWAQRAIKAANTVPNASRDEECDVACAVATHNLAEFAELLDQPQLARQHYSTAIKLATKIGFQEGVEASRARLKLLDKTPSSNV